MKAYPVVESPEIHEDTKPQFKEIFKVIRGVGKARHTKTKGGFLDRSIFETRHPIYDDTFSNLPTLPYDL